MERNKRIAVFAGSFDPITNGHLDILSRAGRIFDEVILLFAINPDKKSRFPLNKRMKAAKEAIRDIPNVRIDQTEGYTVHYCQRVGASFLIRGIRDEKDLAYEKELALANKGIDPTIETVFLLSNPIYNHISSTYIEEISKTGDISPFVPESVIRLYKERS